MAQLLSSLGKKGVSLGLNTQKVDIEDTSYLSTYFNIVEFNPVFSAGKNPVSFNGSSLIQPGSQILVECLDSNGNSLYLEQPKGKSQFSDVASFLISIFVFNETYNGAGKLIIVGKTTKNEIVRWTGNITIDKTLQNSSKVRFYNTPSIEARSLLYPVISDTVGSNLTKNVTLAGNFYTFANSPKKDTFQSSINPKLTPIDYRLILNDDSAITSPQLYPTMSFNSQMEGQIIGFTSSAIQSPFSYKSTDAQITASFVIEDVIDSKTIILNDAFYYPNGNQNVITNVNSGLFKSTYTWVAYNTAVDTYQKYTPVNGPAVFVKDSYAEIVYRNLNTFSGFIARHKLYAKSLLYPGDFALIADEPLGASEILTDPITGNKSYSLMGTFYNQLHIEKYWYTSSNDIQLTAQVTPIINSMTIGSSNYALMDGTKYVIAKNNSPNVVNDALYYPYNSLQFNELSGSSYNSNFIDLKAGSQYALTFDLIINKDVVNTTANLAFYFTSSSPNIQLEQNYINPFGLQLGTIGTADLVSTKFFNGTQTIFFTPNFDYFGTLIIVPFQCNATIANLSLKVYGDYGFSPDVLISKLKFPINIANEAFQLKAELYDINSTLVYSNLQTIQSFDPNGESLFVFISNSNIDPSQTSFLSASITVSESLFLPNIPQCPSENTYLLSYNIPSHHPPLNTEGQVCHTNISNLGNTTDYITISSDSFSGSSLVTTTTTALGVKYDGSNNFGRRIIINNSGSKTIFP